MSLLSLNIGYEWSKTRSLGQISNKPCVHSRGHSFASFFVNLHQKVCLDNVLVKFENGFVGSKTRSIF